MNGTDLAKLLNAGGSGAAIIIAVALTSMTSDIKHLAEKVDKLETTIELIRDKQHAKHPTTAKPVTG